MPIKKFIVFSFSHIFCFDCWCCCCLKENVPDVYEMLLMFVFVCVLRKIKQKNEWKKWRYIKAITTWHGPFQIKWNLITFHLLLFVVSPYHARFFLFCFALFDCQFLIHCTHQLTDVDLILIERIIRIY